MRIIVIGTLGIVSEVVEHVVLIVIGTLGIVIKLWNMRITGILIVIGTLGMVSKVVEYEGNSDTNCNWYTWHCIQSW